MFLSRKRLMFSLMHSMTLLCQEFFIVVGCGCRDPPRTAFVVNHSEEDSAISTTTTPAAPSDREAVNLLNDRVRWKLIAAL